MTVVTYNIDMDDLGQFGAHPYIFLSYRWHKLLVHEVSLFHLYHCTIFNSYLLHSRANPNHIQLHELCPWYNRGSCNSYTSDSRIRSRCGWGTTKSM